MMRSNNNGAWLALGLAGLAAGAAALRGNSGGLAAGAAALRRDGGGLFGSMSHGSGSCACCGVATSGSRDVDEDDEGASEHAEARGTFLLRNRFEAVNAFSISALDAMHLRTHHKNFLKIVSPYFDSLSPEERLAECRRQGEVLRWVFQVSKLVDLPGRDHPVLSAPVDPNDYAAAKGDKKAATITKKIIENLDKPVQASLLGKDRTKELEVSVEALARFLRDNAALAKLPHAKRPAQFKQDISLLKDAIAIHFYGVYLKTMFLSRAWSIGLLDGYINLGRFSTSAGSSNVSAKSSFGAPQYLDESVIGMPPAGTTEQQRKASEKASKAVADAVRRRYEHEREQDHRLLDHNSPKILLLRTPESMGCLPLAMGRDRRVPVYGKGANLFSEIELYLHTEKKVLASGFDFDSASKKVLGQADGQELRSVFGQELRSVFEEEAKKASSTPGGLAPLSKLAEKVHLKDAAKSEQDRAKDEGVESNEMSDGDSVPELYLIGSVRKEGRSVRERVSVFFMAENGTLYFDYGTMRVPLLTKTSKMSSPSFGLPAGIANEGGTCPARKFGQAMVRSKEREVEAIREQIAQLEELIGASEGEGPFRRLKKGQERPAQQMQRFSRLEAQIKRLSQSDPKLKISLTSRDGMQKLFRHLQAKANNLAEQVDAYKHKLICDRCYAMGANYGYANNMIAQEARRQWVMGLARQGGDKKQKSMRFAANLAIMVGGYAQDGQHADREIQEIGVWDSEKEAITYASGASRKPCLPTQLRLQLSQAVLRTAQISALWGAPSQGQTIAAQQGRLLSLDDKPVRDTLSYFERAGVEKGDVCGFFRIHDSGDFGVPGVTSEYIEAWSMVAGMLPQVQFWAPTRVWATMKSVSALDAAEKNFYQRMMREVGPTQDRPSAQISASSQQQNKIEQAKAVPVVAGAPLKTYRLWGQQGSRTAMGLRQASAINDLRVADPAADPTSISPAESGLQNIENDKAASKVVSRFWPLIKSLGDLSRNNPNFAMRPSTLYVTRAALRGGTAVSTGQSANIPYIPGFSAGSGVVEKAEGKAYPEVYDMRGIQAYACPVYTKDESGKEAKSCRDAHCRACWLAQNLPVFYGAH